MQQLGLHVVGTLYMCIIHAWFVLPRDTQIAFKRYVYTITHIGMSSRLVGLYIIKNVSWCAPEPYWQAAATG